MIQHLDATLKTLLEPALADLSGPPEISFDPPDKDFTPNGSAVNLFLYDMRENRELRSNEWRVERRTDGTGTTRHPPPTRVDCSYMVTAWAGDTGSEHRILGRVMKTLLRYPTLPAGALQGDLQAQAVPPPTASLQPGRLQSVGEFWQAMEGKPRAALNYTVTIGVVPDEPVETGPPVTDKQIPGEREA